MSNWLNARLQAVGVISKRVDLGTHATDEAFPLPRHPLAHRFRRVQRKDVYLSGFPGDANEIVRRCMLGLRSARCGMRAASTASTVDGKGTRQCDGFLAPPSVHGGGERSGPRLLRRKGKCCRTIALERAACRLPAPAASSLARLVPFLFLLSSASRPSRSSANTPLVSQCMESVFAPEDYDRLPRSEIGAKAQNYIRGVSASPIPRRLVLSYSTRPPHPLFTSTNGSSFDLNDNVPGHALSFLRALVYYIVCFALPPPLTTLVPVRFLLRVYFRLLFPFLTLPSPLIRSSLSTPAFITLLRAPSPSLLPLSTLSFLLIYTHTLQPCNDPADGASSDYAYHTYSKASQPPINLHCGRGRGRGPLLERPTRAPVPRFPLRARHGVVRDKRKRGAPESEYREERRSARKGNEGTGAASAADDAGAARRVSADAVLQWDGAEDVAASAEARSGTPARRNGRGGRLDTPVVAYIRPGIRPGASAERWGRNAAEDGRGVPGGDECDGGV
ncbi:hypothetical protein B0H13DRAFT_2333029 [Mycena leptocephala]|nr:hypothetical protein B0H13DRAFT_2333029 [Mycena leptocephala]